MSESCGQNSFLLRKDIEEIPINEAEVSQDATKSSGKVLHALYMNDRISRILHIKIFGALLVRLRSSEIAICCLQRPLKVSVGNFQRTKYE